MGAETSHRPGKFAPRWCLFTIELHSEQVRKVSDERDFCCVVPVVSFYTPAPRGEHKSKPSEGAGGGEEEGDEVKTVDQAQQLFDKWFSAIKEGGPVNTFTSVGVAHDFKTRFGSQTPHLFRTVLNHMYGWDCGEKPFHSLGTL